MPDLRKNFFDLMIDIAADPAVIILTGDLGYSKFEGFKEKRPSQLLNCGCIEQSMVGIAAGMALIGRKPYVYSTTPFLLFRALEQIRDDVAYNNLNVKLIGTGASGFLGFSHNLLNSENEEDILKNMPIKRFYPQNEEELKTALLSEGPAFIRI